MDYTEFEEVAYEAIEKRFAKKMGIVNWDILEEGTRQMLINEQPQLYFKCVEEEAEGQGVTD
jgi:hypothetical protein